MKSPNSDGKRKFNILLVIDSLKIGGAERQFVTLVKGLDRKIFNIHIGVLKVSENGFEDMVRECGLKINTFPRRFKFDLVPIFSIYRFIKKNDINIVHSFLVMGALFGMMSAKFAHVPVVCSGIRDAKDQSVVQLLYKKIEAVFADILVSNSYAGFKNRFGKMKPKFRVVYNGIDTARFQSGTKTLANLKNGLNINGFKHYVGMIASLTSHKDHVTFINAASIVNQVVKKVCFLIIGDGQTRTMITELINKTGLSSSFFLTGYRTDTENIYALLDVSVLMTNARQHLEGISNSVLESMVANVPVIASRGGGTDEIIQHNVNGLLVEPGNTQQLADYIIELLTNEEKTSSISKNAYHDVVARFSFKTYVESYTEIYAELLREVKP
jgi:glycosyltransferase involved in cell wall biosynthesis